MAKKDKGRMTADPVTYQIPGPAGGVRLETFIPWTLVTRGVRREVITPLDAPEVFRKDAVDEQLAKEGTQESAMVRALGLAHYWQRLLDEGRYQSITEIAVAEGMDLGQVSRIVRLTRLAPEIVETCLIGKEHVPLLGSLLRRSFPTDWRAQKRARNGRCPGPDVSAAR